MATMTGYDLPQGMCSDWSGDVWLTNTDTQQIFEYNAAATLINTLTDASGFPVGCAWDHKRAISPSQTSSIMVTSRVEILVYRGATGTPTEYQAPGFYYSDGYDNNSDLFFDGCPDYSECEYTTAVLGELPRNFQAPFTFTLSGTVYDPASVQWYSKGSQRYLIVGDQECGGGFSPETSCLNGLGRRLSATITGSISLMNSAGTPACDVVDAVQSGSKVYGGDFESAPSDGFSCTSPSASSAEYGWGFPRRWAPAEEQRAFVVVERAERPRNQQNPRIAYTSA